MLTLVLLPGMDGTGELFNPFVAALGSGFAVNVVRYPTNLSLGYRQLEALARKSLPAKDPFILLGESFSSPIAVSLAASSPTQLKALVLCCGFVCSPRPGLSRLQSVLNTLPDATFSARLLHPLLLGSYGTSALYSAVADALAQVASPVIRARLREILVVNVSDALSTLDVPLLYLRASHDRVVPRTASQRIAQLYPRAQIVELEGPHLLLQAAPMEAARAIRAFISAAI